MQQTHPQFPPAVRSLPIPDTATAAQSPSGDLCAGSATVCAADRVIPDSSYRMTVTDGVRVAITPSRVTPELCVRVARPDGSWHDVWLSLADAEHLADALAWTAQDVRIAEAM